MIKQQQTQETVYFREFAHLISKNDIRAIFRCHGKNKKQKEIFEGRKLQSSE